MPRKPESKFIEAADKATALLQGLQSRLSREAAAAAVAPREETPEELDRQLQEYFGTEAGKSGVGMPGALDQIRDRVIDAVAERILRSWQRGGGELGALENKVIERLAERILDRLGEFGGR